MDKQLFTCKHCKGAPNRGGYPRNWKWKTQRGYDNHSCYKDELAAMEEQKKQREAELLEIAQNAPHKVGDEVYHYHYIVTHPTHEQRGSRLVRVRYEEKRSYQSGYGMIDEIGRYVYKIKGKWIPFSNVRESLEAARQAASEAQAKYQEHCDFSSAVR